MKINQEMKKTIMPYIMLFVLGIIILTALQFAGQKINKINSVKDRTAKYTLGDSSSALLKLKEQLEKEEK